MLEKSLSKSIVKVNIFGNDLITIQSISFAQTIFLIYSFLISILFNSMKFIYDFKIVLEIFFIYLMKNKNK